MTFVTCMQQDIYTAFCLFLFYYTLSVLLTSDYKTKFSGSSKMNLSPQPRQAADPRVLLF